MAYYNNKRIFTKIVLNGVPIVAKLMLTIGEQGIEPEQPQPLEANVTNDILYLTGENTSVTNEVLNIVSDAVSVNNGVLNL